MNEINTKFNVIGKDMNEVNKNETQVRPIFSRFITALKVWWFNLTTKDVHVINATDAFCRATYGENMDKETLIKKHQSQISRLIQDKITFNYDKTNTFGYMCVYAFTDDVKPFISDILHPFECAGYEIINLSKEVEALKYGNVYLLSWYKKSL